MDRGRPTDYRPEYVDLGYKFALLGGTMQRIAELFDVHLDTLYEWMKVHPDFSEALNKGRHIADAEVAQSLYHRAKGIYFEETTYEKVDKKDGLEVSEEGEITEGDQWKKKVVKKFIPPDPASMNIWLKNRQSGKWKDKQVIEQSGPNGDPIKVEHVIKFEDMGDVGEACTK